MPFIQSVPHSLVKEKLLSGESMAAVARSVGLSRQRIFQIAKKLKISSLEIRREKRDGEYLLKYGRKDSSDFYRSCRHKFVMKKAISKRLGVEWSIQFGELDFPSHCPILGLELDYFAEKAQENSPSFDRIDSTRGYISGNVQIVSWRANRIKNDGTSEEHRKIADYLDSTTVVCLEAG